MKTPAEFSEWMQSALIGDRVEYHRGFLSVDIDRLTTTGRQCRDDDMKAQAFVMSKLRDTAYSAARLGHVALVQERVGDKKFSYQAVRI